MMELVDLVVNFMLSIFPVWVWWFILGGLVLGIAFQGLTKKD